MKRTLLFFGLLCAMAVASAQTQRGGKALLVVAHGAPMKSWNAPVVRIEQLVDSLLAAEETTDFRLVRVAMMEYAEPNIAAAVRECEKAGVDSIFICPIFIAPSTHTEFDMPNMLGQKFNMETLAELAEEQTEMVRTRCRITVGSPLCFGSAIYDIITERVRELSIDPKNESLLLICHGDELFIGFWRELMQALAAHVQRETGVAYADFNFVEMGQRFAEDMNPKIEECAAKHQRVIVQGVYLSSSAESFAEGWEYKQTADELAARHGATVVWGPDGLLPKGSLRVAQWVVEQAKAWVRQ